MWHDQMLGVGLGIELIFSDREVVFVDTERWGLETGAVMAELRKVVGLSSAVRHRADRCTAVPDASLGDTRVTQLGTHGGGSGWT